MNSNNVQQKDKVFELLCLELLRKMGYGEPFHNGKGSDKGICSSLTSNNLGLKQIGFQCKCYKTRNINVSEVTHFAFGLKSQRLKGGVFITTTDFTSDVERSSP
ncbi:Restriction endonuclease [Brevinema andersonii]|uniref:Restriction endonuclease n=1 Tax=Brevinema andersonii TaxID=34097 RepID=A0A1I1DLB4_BREAD|nr:Restriction endonuclease [Brevinema andersonii]